MSKIGCSRTIRDKPFAESITSGFYLNIEPDREQLARYGLLVGELQDVIGTALGGGYVVDDKIAVVGFIALAGVAAETGVIMLICIDYAWETVKVMCRAVERTPNVSNF